MPMSDAMNPNPKNPKPQTQRALLVSELNRKPDTSGRKLRVLATILLGGSRVHISRVISTLRKVLTMI